jgi:hypothetical protein
VAFPKVRIHLAPGEKFRAGARKRFTFLDGYQRIPGAFAQCFSLKDLLRVFD